MTNPNFPLRKEAAPSASVPSAEPPPSRAAPYPSSATVIHIGGWSRPVVRGDQDTVDRCDAAVLFRGPVPGTENGFEMRTSVIVGHDHCGFERFAGLPAGTRVSITGPRGVLEYQVYATYVTPGQGGPDHGLYWGDITLQTCVGADTGFSYLQRVRGGTRA